MADFEKVEAIEKEIRQKVNLDKTNPFYRMKPKTKGLLVFRNQLLGRVMDLGAYPENIPFGQVDTMIHYALSYYLADHDIDYKTLEALEEEQQNEIIGIYENMLEAVQKREADARIEDAILHFLEDEAGDRREEILQRVKSMPTERLLYPIDKPNNILWDMARDSAKNGGQINLDVLTGEPANGKEPIVYLSIDFDNLPHGVSITKVLTAFDKRVYIAAGALYNGGNKIVSLSQIYRMMGYEKRPNSNDIQKINDSLTKMGWARLYINNEQETEVIPKYKKMVYDAPLLAFQRKAAYIDGKLVEGAIHIGFEPALIKFARERKQVQKVTLQTLTTPVNKTERNLEIEDYLLGRISQMKSKKRKAQKKILFKSLFTYCRIEARDAQSRSKPTIQKILDHYKETKFITDYSTEADGVTIEP